MSRTGKKVTQGIREQRLTPKQRKAWALQQLKSMGKLAGKASIAVHAVKLDRINEVFGGLPSGVVQYVFEMRVGPAPRKVKNGPE